MALYKAIRQDDGVVTNYHRILFIHNTINSHSSIAVISYVDEVARQDKKTAVIGQPYKRSVTYETDYTEDMIAEKAYDFLKTLPQFMDAENV